ncbi:MAG: hypothetical protein DLM70_02090 [Chloroflexi bacterium]|nr:MAG: hypothetical protein DLM70_02090 [Chloroflexota bacterium]
MPRNRIRQLRYDRDVTLRTLARRVGMDAGQLSRLERGLSSCSLPLALAIAGYLKVSVEDVFPPSVE